MSYIIVFCVVDSDAIIFSVRDNVSIAHRLADRISIYLANIFGNFKRQYIAFSNVNPLFFWYSELKSFRD